MYVDQIHKLDYLIHMGCWCARAVSIQKYFWTLISAASIQERIVLKSGLCWRAYGTYFGHLGRTLEEISLVWYIVLNLNNYFNGHVCPSIRTYVRHKIFFLLKSPWNHPLTPGVDPRG